MGRAYRHGVSVVLLFTADVGERGIEFGIHAQYLYQIHLYHIVVDGLNAAVVLGIGRAFLEIFLVKGLFYDLLNMLVVRYKTCEHLLANVAFILLGQLVVSKLGALVEQCSEQGVVNLGVGVIGFAQLGNLV